MTIKEITQKLISKYPKDQAQIIAYWMLEAITQKTKIELITQDWSLSKDQEATLLKWLDQHLIENKPLQYILGSVPFGPLTISVRPPTLIPRPETEEWCENIIEQLRPYKDKKLTILDMCTGSGCIGLWIAYALPNATVYAVDLSDKALELAKENAKKNTIENIQFIKSDLFTNIPDDIKFDLIVSNPPYVTHDEWEQLETNVKVWEDKNALVADNDGLQLIEQIIIESKKRLKKDSTLSNAPKLIIEMGYLQGPSVKELFENSNYSNVTINKDFCEKDRTVSGL
jgi:release factor glutamine methyltransferase